MRKLARVRDCLSFLIPSTRVVVYRHYYEKFSPGFLSLVLSFIYACLSISFLFTCSSVFSHIFFIRIVPKTSFSLFFFYINYEVLSTVMQQSKRSHKKKKKKEKLSLLLPSSLYAFISIAFFALDVIKKN
jgi:hypothetical protein